MTKLTEIRRELKSLADPKRAKVLQRFFKTGKGEYGEGDIFHGILVPVQRKVAKRYRDLTLKDVGALLKSKIHEERLTALFVLVNRFEKGDGAERKDVYEFYLKNTSRVNNWDLVDLSAPKIVGAYLLDKPRDVLYELAESEDLWERRISILSTLAFIRNNEFINTLIIAKMLLGDRHDLIHKAVGWMLREVGKRDQSVEEAFLDMHYNIMPRTMLRYAIERFEEKKRKSYLNRK